MIKVENLSYSVGSFTLQASLSVQQGEYFVLLGTTGSGKTLFLENLCGLRDPTAGSVWIGEKDVTCAEPRQRGIGYVPQDGALFAHLKVKDNIGFALRLRGMERAERDGRVGAIAGMLGIGHLLDRRTTGLSGGERQRVALARALAGSPEALLLDEPVSALDEFTRSLVCRELVRLQRDARMPVVHVCHSFDEARLVADRVGVMRDGRIVQTGTPDELFVKPRDANVARLLGLENVFSGIATTRDGKSQIRVGEIVIQGPEVADGPVEFLVRPWEIVVLRDGKSGAVNTVQGIVEHFSSAGATVRLRVAGALPLAAHISRREAEGLSPVPGERVLLGFGTQAVHLLL